MAATAAATRFLCFRARVGVGARHAPRGAEPPSQWRDERSRCHSDARERRSAASRPSARRPPPCLRARRRYADVGKVLELWNLSAADKAMLARAKDLCGSVAFKDVPGAWAAIAASQRAC